MTGAEGFLPADINDEKFYDIYDTDFFCGRLTKEEIIGYLGLHSTQGNTYLPPAVDKIMNGLCNLASEKNISFPEIAEEFFEHRRERLAGAYDILIKKYKEGESKTSEEIKNVSQKSTNTLESSFKDQCGIIDSQFRTMGFVFFLEYFTKAVYSYNNGYLVNDFDRNFSEKVIHISEQRGETTQRIIEIILKNLQNGVKLNDSLNNLGMGESSSQVKTSLDGIVCSILEEDTDAKRLAEMVEGSCKGEVIFSQEIADLFVLIPLISFRLKTSIEEFCNTLIARCFEDTSKSTEDIAYEMRIYLVSMKTALGI